jgi:4-aminobutyrate aminotransferase-like enzyme
MDLTLQQATSLTPQQRQAYSRHLMPYVTPQNALHITGGQGVYFQDIHGKRYIDLTTQMFACYLGLGNNEIAEVIYDQARIMTIVHPHMQTDLRYSLAHRLAEIAPANLNRVAFTVGGGPAIESAIKIALKNVRGAQRFITLRGAYHGGTFVSVAATVEAPQPQAVGDGRSLPISAFLSSSFIRAPHPFCYRCPFAMKPESCDTFCVEALRQTMVEQGEGQIAGVILEPLQSSGGEFPFPKAYLQRAREICDQSGALLIFDEIQCFARTGKWFAADYYGVEPDIIVMGKGIGGGVPIAGIIIHDRLTPFEHLGEDLHTYQNNHIGFAAAFKTLEIIERDHLLEHAIEMGDHFKRGFRELQRTLPEIGDVRGVGLKIGVELVKDPETREPLPRDVTNRILAKSMEKGLFFQITGQSIIKVKPALIIQRDEIDRALAILEEAMTEVLRPEAVR